MMMIQILLHIHEFLALQFAGSAINRRKGNEQWFITKAIEHLFDIFVLNDRGSQLCCGCF